MKADKRIAIIIPYYGSVPWYYRYFLHSCKFNNGIDFYIITDNTSFENKEIKNVSVIYKSLDSLKELFANKLQLQIFFETPYKLSDFKPTYGLVFSELVKDYEFWGYGDIDNIFGNTRNFILDEMLNEFDVISFRNDYLTGNFCLFKNIDKINNLFSHSRDYKRVLSGTEHYCFDETNFAWNQFEEGLSYEQINCEIESMTHVVKRLHKERVINAYFDFHVIEGLPGKLKWQNGTLTYKNEFEVLLYHMILFKKIYYPKNRINNISDTFYISPTRIYY